MADRDLVGRTLGEFVLREPIGKGSYGTVYRCDQPVLKRSAVVKVLLDRRQGNNGSRERFLREAQLASRLQHPYATKIYAFGAEQRDGILWIAMELVHGIPLDKWLETHGPMPPEQFVPFFECVAEVVQEAHERGIVHRDLKPSNMMVIEQGGRLFPKLLDFGIAKMSPEIALPMSAPPMPASSSEGSLAEDRETEGTPGPDDVVTARIGPTPQRVRRTRPVDDPACSAPIRLTGSGACLGSGAYMSPEQWCDPEAVGPAADIYSLGVVAFEALTGHVPFTAESTDELFRKHRYAEVPMLGADFVPDLNRVIRCALAKYPQARYRNVLELASALRAALRVSEREQIRTSAQQWEDRGRPTGLLWGADVLVDVADRVPPEVLSKLECSFIATGQRRARRVRWLRRFVVTLVAVGAVAIAAMKTRLAQEQAHSAQQLADVTVTQAELEQGRAALLHGEPEAQSHLSKAYDRGDHSPSTTFMLARALQPRLAEQARLTSSFGRMWSAAFSPDGLQVVTTDDKTAQLWDAQSMRLLFTLSHGDIVFQAVYSPDSKKLATAAADGFVRIWDATNGVLLHALRQSAKQRRYFVVAISPDGHLVAAIDVNGEVAHVWDARTGVALAELQGDASKLPSLAFSADGRWLVASGGDDVRVFDTATWTRALTLPGPRIDSLAFDPTGPRLATGTVGGDVSIWAIPSGERVRHLREIGEPIDRVAFSSDGTTIVTASRDGTEQIWNAQSGRLQSQTNYLRGKILSAEFDSTGKFVLAASANGTIAVSDALQGMVPVAVFAGPASPVWITHFDPRSRRIIGASFDGTARLWDAAPSYRRWSSSPVDDDCDTDESLEPDQRFIAISCRNHGTRVWDTGHAQLLAELPSVTPVEGDFTSSFPAVSAAGDRAAIARGNTVELYELPGSKLIRTITHGAPVNAVAFASTGHDFVSGAVDGSLLVMHDGHEPIALPVSPDGIDVVTILTDGRVVAAAGKRLRVYDPDHSTILADLAVETRVRLFRQAPDGLRFLTLSIGARQAAPLMLWDLERYRLITPLIGHVGRVFSARFVAQGREILTAGGDGTARLWDPMGRLIQTYRGNSRFMVDATLSPDGSTVVAGGADGLLRFWDAAGGLPLWTLQAHKSHVLGIHFEGDDLVTRGFAGDIARWTLPKPEQVIEACNAREACAKMLK